jgi:hypothetical protein
MARVARWFVLPLLALLLLLGMGAFLLLHSGAGQRLVLRTALNVANGQIQGTIRVQGIRSPGLLRGLTLDGLSIVDEQSRPFLEADSARVGYGVRGILARRAVLEPLELWAPRVTVETLPGDTVPNVVRIFAPDAPREPGADPGEDPEPPNFHLELRRVRIHDGEVVVRSPDQEDLVVRGIEARIPRAVLLDPDEPGETVWFDRLALEVTLPGVGEGPLTLDDLRGQVVRRGQRLEVEARSLRLPHSAAQGVLAVDWSGETLALEMDLEANPFDARDLAWLDPRIPQVRGQFRLQGEGPLDQATFRFTEVDLATDRDRVQGRLGIVMGERPRLLDSELEVEVWAELAQPWLEEPLPVEGRLRSTLRAEGALDGLQVEGSFSLDDPGRGIPATDGTVRGRLDLERVRVQGLELRLDPLRLATLDLFPGFDPGPDLRLAGEGSLQLVASGGIDEGIDLQASLVHSTAAVDLSRITARGRVARAGDTFRLDLDTTFEPLHWGGLASGTGLDLPLEGELTGSLRLVGLLTDLEATGELETPGGGVQLSARLDATDPARGYRVDGSTEELRLDQVLAQAPPGSLLTGSFQVEGRGFDLATLVAEGQVEARDLRWGEWEVSSADLQARAAEGRLHLDSLSVRSAAGEVEGAGDLALVREAPEGRLDLRWRLEDLGTLRPVLLGETPVDADTLSLLERNLLALEGFADSPEAEPPTPLAGALEGELSLEGSLPDLRVHLELRGEGLMWRAAEVADLRLAGSARLGTGEDQAPAPAAGQDAFIPVGSRADEGGEPTDAPGWRLHSMELEGRAEEARWGRFDFQEVEFTAQGALDALQVALELERNGEEGTGGEGYRTAGVVSLGEGGVAYAVEELRLDLGDVVWSLAAPSRIAWSEGTVQVEELEVTRPPNGDAGGVGADAVRIWVDGSLDLDGTLDLRAQARGVDVARVARIAQIDPAPEGLLDLDLRINGVASDPRIDGEIRLVEVEVGGSRLSRVEGEFSYADETARVSMEVDQNGNRLLTLSGHYPVNLALGDVETRFPSRDVDLVAVIDDLPAATLLAPLEALEEVRGSVAGEITLRGRPDDLRPEGQLTLSGGAFALPEIGLSPSELEASFTVQPDGVVAVRASARSVGTMELSGTVDLSNLMDPGFDLSIEAQGFEAVSRRDLDGRVTGNMQLRGRYEEPRVTGNIRVDQANLFLEEFARTAEVVDLTDPLFFERGFLEEEASAALRPVLEAARNPFLDNLRVDAELSLPRDVWLRSREMNVEIGGDLLVTFDRRSREVLLVGQVEALRGNYNAFGRQFQVRGGTVDFVGTPGINPSLNIEAVHRLRQQGGEPLDIVATLEGTLLAMRIGLSTEAGVNISESDLISYLIFGRPSFALGSAESRILGDAAISAGIGAAAGQLSSLLGQRIGLDFFNITQAQDPGAGLGALSSEGLVDTQVELGQYLSDNVFLALVLRPLQGIGGSQAQIPGARLEWRFSDLWTLNAYLEDRFGREGVYTFGEAGLQVNRIFGLEIFREWGY